MEQIPLGASGLKVSRIGLGMWQAAGGPWGEARDEDCIDAMVRAHQLGITLVDTAEAYGNGRSEEVVGRALQKLDRDDVVVATKVVGSHLRYEHVLKACDRSRRRLGVDVIDLYQVHWPDPWRQVPLSETMRAMEQLYKEEKVRAVGVSNFAVRDLEEARATLSSTEVVSNQVQYSMVHREIEKELLPYCQREGIPVLAWSPLGKGLLTGKYGPDNRPQDPLRKDHVLFREKNLAAVAPLLEEVRTAADSHGKTPAQVALNWLASKEGVIPIPGARNPEHVEGNAGAVGWNLTEEEVVSLEDAMNRVEIDPF